MQIMKFAVGGLVAALAAVAVNAAGHNAVDPDINDVATLRINAMQNAGAGMGVLANIARGNAEYDAVAVALALRTIQGTALALRGLTPEGSNANPRSNALDTIWADPAGFSATIATFIDSTTGFVRAVPTDVDGVRAAMGQIGQSCQACHKTYRKPM